MPCVLLVTIPYPHADLVFTSHAIDHLLIGEATMVTAETATAYQVVALATVAVL